MHEFLYLASRSPRRQELLQRLGIPYRLLIPTDADSAEALEAVLPGEAPTHYVRRVARAKLDAALAARAAANLPEAPILAVDTTVALGGRILGKPADADAAREMLSALSGRTHRVLTALALAHGNRQRLLVQVSRVEFARLGRDQIERYVASGEPFDKAGGYGIQGAAGAFARRIEGSESGIMGLPLYETSRLLRGLVRTA